MLAKILGQQIGEKLTNLESTSVGLYPTLTSVLDKAQPKSSCLKQTLQQIFSLGHRAKNLTKAVAIGALYKQVNLDFPLRVLTPHFPQNKFCWDLISANTRQYQPHGAGCVTSISLPP